MSKRSTQVCLKANSDGSSDQYETTRGSGWGCTGTFRSPCTNTFVLKITPKIECIKNTILYFTFHVTILEVQIVSSPMSLNRTFDYLKIHPSPSSFINDRSQKLFAF